MQLPEMQKERILLLFPLRAQAAARAERKNYIQTKFACSKQRSKIYCSCIEKVEWSLCDEDADTYEGTW